LDIEIGDFVKVQGDRGVDLGVVLNKFPVLNYIEQLRTAGVRGKGFTFKADEIRYLLGRASPEEVRSSHFHISHIVRNHVPVLFFLRKPFYL
jgi:hypothetical protein